MQKHIEQHPAPYAPYDRARTETTTITWLPPFPNATPCLDPGTNAISDPSDKPTTNINDADTLLKNAPPTKQYGECVNTRWTNGPRFTDEKMGMGTDSCFHHMEASERPAQVITTLAPHLDLRTSIQ